MLSIYDVGVHGASQSIDHLGLLSIESSALRLVVEGNDGRVRTMRCTWSLRCASLLASESAKASPTTLGAFHVHSVLWA